MVDQNMSCKLRNVVNFLRDKGSIVHYITLPGIEKKQQLLHRIHPRRPSGS